MDWHDYLFSNRDWARRLCPDLRSNLDNPGLDDNELRLWTWWQIRLENFPWGMYATEKTAQQEAVEESP